MKELFIDIETFSPEDLKTAGVYRYTESPMFEILLFAYSFGINDPVKIIDITAEEAFPPDLIGALASPDCLKIAHNANFERICLENCFDFDVPLASWRCSAVKSAACGLPRDLDGAYKALGLPEQEGKMDGKQLINYFCKPVKPTKANGGRVFNSPADSPDKWAEFKQYCKQDVVAEMHIWEALRPYEMTDQDDYILDQKINDRGVLVDMSFAQSAQHMAEKATHDIKKEMKDITGLDNPNSPAQLKKWFLDEFDLEINSLDKKCMPLLLERATDDDPTGVAVKVLELRSQASKTSSTKYKSMLASVNYDARTRGLFMYNGAHTGRWSSKRVQLHNMKQNHLDDMDSDRDLVASGFSDFFKDPTDTLGQLVRSALIAKPGHMLAVCDLSAIEARVLAWVAGAEDRLKVFRGKGNIYEVSGSKMFGVPVEKVTKGSDLRAKAKVAELALGYQGSVGALTAMGGEALGLSQEEMKKIVHLWRKNNPEIKALWDAVNAAAIRAVVSGQVKHLPKGVGDIAFKATRDFLTIKLPSGRYLYYPQPTIINNKFKSKAVAYMGIDSQTKQRKRIDTYGGKFVENIVQAIARDILAGSMISIDAMSLNIVMHVHDEAVCEVPEDEAEGALETMVELMSAPPSWAPGLPLAAEGFISPYYKKD